MFSLALSTAQLSQNFHAGTSPSSFKDKFMPKKDYYSSFTSLIWQQVGPNRLKWQGGLVWGVGVEPSGAGLWFSSRHTNAFSTQFDAQAAFEFAYLEERKPPASDKAVDKVAAQCNAIVAVSYRQLVSRSGLTDGALDDAIVRAADEGRIQIAVEEGRFIGYKLIPSFKTIPRPEVVNVEELNQQLPVANTQNLALYQNARKGVLGDLEVTTKRREALSNILAAVSSLREIDARPPADATPEITDKTFEGMELVQAAVKYLSIVMQAQTIREILEGLRKGGYKTNAANPLDTVRSVLKRDSLRGHTLLSLQGDLWSLKEWGEPRQDTTSLSDANLAYEKALFEVIRDEEKLTGQRDALGEIVAGIQKLQEVEGGQLRTH